MLEHDERCKAIAQELEMIAEGKAVVIDYEIFEVLYDDNETPYAAYAHTEKEYYTENGEPITIDGETIETTEKEFEIASMYDYFCECYNIDYIVDQNKDYKACRIMVACGGPNIYVNTWNSCVELHWWGEKGKCDLPNYVCDEIDGVFEEFYRG